jgi:hypothetical protein
MPAWALEAEARLLRGRPAPADRFWADPTRIMARMDPDPWQADLLRAPPQRTLLLCARQVGKSTTAAAMALQAAILEPPALVLIVSPSERQSGELLNKIKGFYAALSRSPRPFRRPARGPRKASELNATAAALDEAWQALPAPDRESALQLHLANGSRVIGLPGKPATILGYSGVSLLIVDEAARVPDELYRSVRPMLATSRGRLLALSSPFGKRGWFHDEWHSPARWKRVRVKAEDCARIPPEFLAEERMALGERWYRQEYECSFEDVVGAVFSGEDIAAAFAAGDDLLPLFPQGGANDACEASAGDNALTPLFAGGEF